MNQFNQIKLISEKELLQKVEDGVSKKSIWKKPLLLLTKDGADYNYILDLLNETYHDKCVNTDPLYFEFVRANGKLELSLNGTIVHNNQSDIDYYSYLGGPLAFDEKIHRYCVNLIEYDAKPVISFICVADKHCSIEEIPQWMKEEYDIAMLKLHF